MSCISSVPMSHPSLHQDCLQSFSLTRHSTEQDILTPHPPVGRAFLTKHWLLSQRAGEESGAGAVTTEMLLTEYQRQPVKQRALWGHPVSLIYSTTSITLFLFFELLETYLTALGQNTAILGRVLASQVLPLLKKRKKTIGGEEAAWRVSCQLKMLSPPGGTAVL